MSKREKAQREVRILAEPETLDELCEFIAERGTLSSWCRSRQLRYTPVYLWLYDAAHPDRLARYAKALEGRSASLADLLDDSIRETVEADVTKLFDDRGLPVEPNRVPDALRRVVSKVKITEKVDERKVEYDLDSRSTAREQLGKRLGLFKDKVEHSGNVAVTDPDPEGTARRLAFILAAGVRQARKPDETNGTNGKRKGTK